MCLLLADYFIDVFWLNYHHNQSLTTKRGNATLRHA